jgi:hypothetical protein
MGSTATGRPQPSQADAAGQDPIGKGQIKQAVAVLLAGALGGLLFWVLNKWSGTPSFAGWPWYGQILALLFLGGIAALFGVYLLTASNMNVMKTYVFAIVCGIVWQPIINTAIKSYSNANITRQVAAVNNQTEQLKNTADHGSSAEIQSAVNATVPGVTQALKVTDVQDADKKQAIVESSDKALAAFQSAAVKAPDSSIQAIKEVGIAASLGNHADVGLHAVNSLREIGIAGATSNRPEVARASIESLRTLSVSGKDPGLKNAAAASLKEIEANSKQ